MAKQRAAALGSHTAVTTGTAQDIADGETADVYVSGTFVGTVIIEASPDGTNWAPVTSGTLTAPGVVRLPPTCKKVRARTSAFTSGTIVSTVGLRDDDHKG